MSKQGQQGSSLIAQQGLAKSSSESTNVNETIKEHPSSSAPFEDKKDFFEKLSAQSDDQVQQGSTVGIGQQDTSTSTNKGPTSDLKQTSGSSDIKQEKFITPQQGSSSDLKEGSFGSSEFKQESFKEHPSSSAPFEDKKDFFEKLSAESDDQVQQGSTVGIGQQDTATSTNKGPSSDLKQTSGSSDIKQERTVTPQQGSFGLKDTHLGKDNFDKQEGGDKDDKWQGPSDETEFNNFGNKVTSDLKQSPATSDFKESSSSIKGSNVKTEKGKRGSDLIDFASKGGIDLSGEMSNLKIDSSSSIGQTKKQSLETGPFYDDKVHDDTNETK